MASHPPQAVLQFQLRVQVQTSERLCCAITGCKCCSQGGEERTLGRHHPTCQNMYYFSN